MNLKFTKMQGTGNDFIVIEDFDLKLLNEQDKLAQKLCDRRFGIGADGILFVRKSEAADIKMEIINADGSYAAMCGNGIRCFAKYVLDEKLVSNKNIKIETGDGIKIAAVKLEKNGAANVTIDMGNYSLNPKDIPAESEETIINKKIIVGNMEYEIISMLMGVPHTVIISKLDDVDINEGKAIEKYKLFPKGTNVNFCEVIDKNNIKVKTWERGAGPTLACGTGSCAAVIASNLIGLTEKEVKVQVPGGEMQIKISDDSIFMTGPAVTVYKGEI